MMTAVYIVIGILLGASLGVILFKLQQKQIVETAKERANSLSKDAKRKADDLVKDSERKAREAVDQARRKYEQSVQQKLEEVKRHEQKAKDIERNLADEK